MLPETPGPLNEPPTGEPVSALGSRLVSANAYLGAAPIVGALVVTRKAWDEMAPAVQDVVRTASDRAGVQIRAKARQEVDDAVDAMKKRGLVVHRPNPEQMREWNDLAEKLYPRIRGAMVPADTFDFADVKPIYEELPGWSGDIRSARRMEDLPENARAYLDFIAEKTGVPVAIVSVGPDRAETIVVRGHDLCRRVVHRARGVLRGNVVLGGDRPRVLPGAV